MTEESVGQVVAVQKSSEQRGPEPRATYLRRSHTEFARFFDELKALGVTRHFTNTSGEKEEGEFYDYNKNGTSYGGSEGDTEFRLVRQGRHYYLDSHTVTKVGKTFPTSREGNNTEGERFESDPKKLSYVRTEYKPKVDPPHVVLDRIEVSDGFLSKKGTAEEARMIMDNLNARLAVLRQKVSPVY